jgi:hypothetical protein
MNQYKVLGFTLFLCAVAFLTLIPGLSGQQQGSSSKSQSRHFDENRFPVADFSAPESADPAERAKRRARGQKYDKSEWAVNPNSVSDSTVRVDSVDLNLPAFPLKQSKAVVIGKVPQAREFQFNFFNNRVEPLHAMFNWNA